MKNPICIIHNDRFTISFKTTNQMFYHLYRLLTLYGDEISFNSEFEEEIKNLCLGIQVISSEVNNNE